MYHYSVPPPQYVRYDYNTSRETSPSADDTYTYYIPRPTTKPTASPTAKRHSRQASYSTPRRPAGWHSPAGYPSPGYYATVPDYTSPPARHDHVSNSEHIKSKARRFSMSGNEPSGSGNGTKRRASVRSQGQRIIIDVVDEAYYSPTYTYMGQRKDRRPKGKGKADYYFSSNQVPRQEPVSESLPKPRPRRTSETKPKPSPPKPAAKATTPPRQATAADAAKAGIPAGYSTKNWDPTEEPILLLGSVFDANSLGKWIYDWTVYHHGSATPMSDVAGDLWLLLIKLAGKMRRAEECLPRIRSASNYEMMEEFLVSGERLWDRLKSLLKTCEEFMWKVAKRNGSKGAVKMGKNSGCEFVDSIFGRDRELEKTERLMASINLWNKRFDANCEDILRRPSAA